MNLKLFCSCVVLCCYLVTFSNAAVISIDFGSEWVKVALVKPGVPMEIVINQESKRKTAALVSLRNDERLFGDAALNTAVKHPKNAYRYLQLLVGQKFSSPLVQMYREWFPWYDMKKDEERGTVLFQHDSQTVYSPDELIAMIFNHSRQFAEIYADQTTIRDVVITVPAFFNQAQRKAIRQSANLVGLNVLQLMSDNAAAALNYGVFRQNSFNTTAQYVMFYDMGALSTTATVVEYRKAQVKEGSVANIHPQLTIKGTGYDRTLGGLQMEIRLRDHLAKIFESQKKTQGSVYDSPRAMSKLLKEAKRVKQVLSANNDHTAQIEGLLEDVDFKASVSRKEVEELCTDLFERVGGPVTQALEAADMTMDEIDSVVLVGGGTRVPKVQETLLQVVNKPDLGKSLNTDEAIAMGAVYQGAAHSKLFRVKKFIVKEGAVFPIQVSFSRVNTIEGEEGEEPQEVTKIVKRTLFHRSNTYPQKKVLTFNRYSNDFSFQVFYGDLDFLSQEEKSYLGRLNISEVYLAGVGEAMESNKQGESKGIKAHFRMDESGILNLDNVESVFEYSGDGKPEEESTLSKLSSAFSSFFGGGGEDEAVKTEDDDNIEIPVDNLTSPETTPTDDSSRSDSSEGTDDTSGQEKPTGEKEEKTRDKSTETEHDEVSPEEEDVRKETANEEEESSTERDDTTSEGKEGKETEERAQTDEEPTENDEGNTDSETEGTDSNSTNTSSSDTELPKNNTTAGKTKSSNKTKDKTAPKENVVKVNLTAEVTLLDLSPPSEGSLKVSVEKLQSLQQRDDDKLANEQAKNSLESHIFETKDAMYSDAVTAVSTEEQRDIILSDLNEAGLWMEEDGYSADTKTYKDKLRELKRASRALFKRVEEAARLPRYLTVLESSLNISHDFLARMKNLTEEIQIFTEVEMSTLETLINETEEWLAKMLKQQKATPPHEDPVLLSYEVDEHTKRIDREVMYLLNKLRSHPPPKPKTTANATNASNTSKPTTDEGTTDVPAETDKQESTSEDQSEKEDQQSTDTPVTPAADEDAGTTDESNDEAVEEPETEEPTNTDDQKHKEL